MTFTMKCVVRYLIAPLVIGVLGVRAEPLMLAAPPAAAPVSRRPVPLTSDERLLLVLDRFTYGPRPGDLESLRAMGLQAWFNRQLSPQTISDGELDRRLDGFPAMRLPLPDLMAMFPNRQVLRKEANGRTEQLAGQVADAIYRDAAERYAEKQQNKAGSTDKDINPSAGSTPLPVSVANLIAMPVASRFSALCGFSFQQLAELRRTTWGSERARLIDGFSPQQREALVAFENPAALVTAEDVQSKLIRDVFSERQLSEVMVDFWLNHFNVYMNKSQDAPYYIAAYERDAIRPHALGSFESLLIATAGSPAMLNYLDNAQSVGPHSDFAERSQAKGGPQKKQTGLNENYARELMELHTLGVNGGYTQKDVTEVAKVFTGWTIGSRQPGGLPAQAEFDERKHEPGTKMVLGVKVKEGGEKERMQVLHMLASSPQTARFISTKLAVRFVTDDPPKQLVDRMTQTFLSSHGDIRKVMLAMVHSPQFFTAETNRAKVKTPQEFVLSAVRASGAEVDSAGALANAIATLGMPVYGMQTPNGYSMKAEPWNSSASLIGRLNFALALATNRVVGVKVDWSNGEPVSGQVASMADPTEHELELERRLLHLAASERTRSAVLAQISIDPVQQQASLKQIALVDRRRDPLALGDTGGQVQPLPSGEVQAALTAGLLLGSPEFQRR